MKKTIKIKRTRIDFQKLIDGYYYPVEIHLFIFDWILKTGYEHESFGDGLDRAIYGYSGNNYRSGTDMGPDIRKTLFIGFCNVLCKTSHGAVKKYKTEQRVQLDKYRMLEIPEQSLPETYYTGQSGDECLYYHRTIIGEIESLYKYKGRRLKKKHFHPEYTCDLRKEPFVKSIKFTTTGRGYYMEFDFSFKGLESSGWSRQINQDPLESINVFVNRVHSVMKEFMLEEEIYHRYKNNGK